MGVTNRTNEKVMVPVCDSDQRSPAQNIKMEHISDHQKRDGPGTPPPVVDQRSPTQNIERGHVSDHQTGEGLVTIRRHKVLRGREPRDEQDGTDPESPDRGHQLKQRTVQGPDIHKRENDQHVTDRDNVDSGLVHLNLIVSFK